MSHEVGASVTGMRRDSTEPNDGKGVAAAKVPPGTQPGEAQPKAGASPFTPGEVRTVPYLCNPCECGGSPECPRCERTPTCSHRGCLSIADPAPRREWERQGTCAKHRQAERTKAGVCLNCAASLVGRYELNELTGRLLIRDGEPVLLQTCAEACGYSRRARPNRRAGGVQ